MSDQVNTREVAVSTKLLIWSEGTDLMMPVIET